jgi:predicted nucleotidyltransferase
MREVDRLVEAGFALDRRVGNTRLVKANANHPMFSAVRELVLYAYGPVAVLSPIIRKINGVSKAYIYGSWAARVQGEPGADPGDIDVLLVSNLTSFDAYEIGQEASKIMKREVNVQNISTEAWDTADSGFVKTLKSKPLIELNLA